MTKKGQKLGLKWKFFGLYLKIDHGKKLRVENRKFLGEISKKGHREFGVPGNLFYKKALNKSVFENYPLPNLSRQPAGFLLSRRRPQICGLAEFKPQLLLSRPEIYSKPAWGSRVYNTI